MCFFCLLGAGTAGEVPSKIFSLKLLTCTSIRMSARSDFQDVFCFNERDLGTTNAVAAVMTDFHSDCANTISQTFF